MPRLGPRIEPIVHATSPMNKRNLGAFGIHGLPEVMLTTLN